MSLNDGLASGGAIFENCKTLSFASRAPALLATLISGTGGSISLVVADGTVPTSRTWWSSLGLPLSAPRIHEG